jgi:hypothetical protein
LSLTTTITARIQAELTNALDLATARVPLDDNTRLTLSSGTGADAADLTFHDRRTINASANEDLDLVAVLSSALGSTLTFVELKAIKIVAAAANTNNVRLTRPATNGVPLFLAAGGGLDIPPGGVLLWANPGDGDVTVTASTGDLLNVANSAAGTPVTYDITIIGTSA